MIHKFIEFRIYYHQLIISFFQYLAGVMPEEERKIVNEFCHFLEKSKQLFNGLRDLPQYGDLYNIFCLENLIIPGKIYYKFLQVTNNGKPILDVHLIYIPK